MFTLVRAAGLALALSAAPAVAQVVTTADWAERPTPEQVGHAYPPLAMALGMEGSAILACDVTAGGILENCKVESETPKEFGFAAAARSLTPYFRMRPEVRDGRSVTSEVRIPLRFYLPEPEARPELAPPKSSRALSLARQFAAMSGVEAGYRTIYDLKAQYLEIVRTPGSTPESRKTAASAVRGAAEGRLPEVLEAIAVAYATHYSEEELETFVKLARGGSPPVSLVPRPSLGQLQAKLMMEFSRRIEVSARTKFCETQACAPDRDFGLPRPDAPGPRVTINAPIWLERPTFAQISAAHPPLAQVLRIEGRVHLACTIAQLGIVDSCEVAEESPAGLGFGAAAQTLKGFFRLSPAMQQREGGDVAAVQVRFAPERDIRPTYEPPSGAIEPARLEAARRYVSLTVSDQYREQQLDISLRTIEAMRMEGVTREVRLATVEAWRRAALAVWPEFMELYARALAAELTERELAQAASFAASPAGRAFAARATEMDDETRAILTAYDLIVSADAGRDYCKVRGCTGPAERRPRPPAASRRRS